MRRLSLFLTTVVFVLIACGGSSGPIVPGDDPLDEADYRSYLDQVWESIAEQLVTLPEQFTDVDDFEGAATATADVYEDYVSQLDRAVPPSRFEDVHDQLRQAADLFSQQLNLAAESGVPLDSNVAIAVAELLNTACRDLELRLSVIGEHGAECVSQ